MRSFRASAVCGAVIREVAGRYELNGPLPPLAIPSTLQDSLMARLDRLASVRDIAQLGATVGREFNYNLLQAISPLNEDTLQRGLKQLVEAELVYQSGLPPRRGICPSMHWCRRRPISRY